MKWKKITAVVLSLAMMVTMLTACGGGGSGGSGSFSNRVNSLLKSIGSEARVEPSSALDAAVKEYAEKETITGNTEDDGSVTNILGEKLSWGNTTESSITSGLGMVVLDSWYKEGHSLIENPGDLESPSDESVTQVLNMLNKLGAIDSPEKQMAGLAALMYELFEIVKDTAEEQGDEAPVLYEMNVSCAKATTVDGDPCWVVALQITASSVDNSASELTATMSAAV